jgi:hypothetical protein
MSLPFLRVHVHHLLGNSSVFKEEFNPAGTSTKIFYAFFATDKCSSCHKFYGSIFEWDFLYLVASIGHSSMHFSANFFSFTTMWISFHDSGTQVLLEAFLYTPIFCNSMGPHVSNDLAQLLGKLTYRNALAVKLKMRMAAFQRHRCGEAGRG